MGAVPDLNLPIWFRGINLNEGFVQQTVNGKPVLIGCVVDTFDPTAVEVRQFREPLALVDGIDTGGTWRGARSLQMQGTVADKTRGETFDRLAAIEEIMLPASGTFGHTDLTWWTISGAGSTPTQKVLSVLPNGLRYNMARDVHGGDNTDSLSIAWSVTFYARRPAITDA